MRWFWSLAGNGPMTRADRVATLEEAKAQFQKSWDEWKAGRRWRRLSERPLQDFRIRPPPEPATTPLN